MSHLALHALELPEGPASTSREAFVVFAYCAPTICGFFAAQSGQSAAAIHPPSARRTYVNFAADSRTRAGHV
jgi:hypothetical protein